MAILFAASIALFNSCEQNKTKLSNEGLAKVIKEHPELVLDSESKVVVLELAEHMDRYRYPLTNNRLHRTRTKIVDIAPITNGEITGIQTGNFTDIDDNGGEVGGYSNDVDNLGIKPNHNNANYVKYQHNANDAVIGANDETITYIESKNGTVFEIVMSRKTATVIFAKMLEPNGDKLKFGIDSDGKLTGKVFGTQDVLNDFGMQITELNQAFEHTTNK
jgi:hypothetical protein